MRSRKRGQISNFILLLSTPEPLSRTFYRGSPGKCSVRGPSARPFLPILQKLDRPITDRASRSGRFLATDTPFIDARKPHTSAGVPHRGKRFSPDEVHFVRLIHCMTALRDPHSRRDPRRRVRNDNLPPFPPPPPGRDLGYSVARAISGADPNTPQLIQDRACRISLKAPCSRIITP